MTSNETDQAPLAEIETDGFVLRLRLAEDGMACRAWLAPGPVPGPGPTPDELLALLAESGVAEGIDHDALVAVSACDPAAFPPEGIEIARGTPPSPPHDSYVDLSVRPDTGIAHYIESADGTIDFRDRSDYDLVEAGQEIGVFHPPRVGHPGLTVTGRTIPVESPSSTSIAFGAGVKLDRESNRIAATTAGRVLFVANALSVEEEYVVRGDVDFSVGNIRNPGFVVVSGDVWDNFSVTGGKGIKIGGIVGAATLRSNGDITVTGVTGKGKGRIVCGGNLHARFLSEVEVECRGDVIVETEIRAATVHAGGMILMPNGVIASGECIAGRGIEVKTAGSIMGVTTILSAGIDYRVHRKVDALKEKIRRLEREIAALEASVGVDPPEETALIAMPPSQRESLEKQFGKLATLSAEAAQARDEISRSNTESDPSSNAMVNIRGNIYEGTVVHLWHADIRIAEEQRGPVSIIENTLDGTLRFLPLHPLKKNAREIEAALLEVPAADATPS
ncbi:MAG TPA: FapA family protein [Candidatus Deferrimicrobiaceae bacterium]